MELRELKLFFDCFCVKEEGKASERCVEEITRSQLTVKFTSKIYWSCSRAKWQAVDLIAHSHDTKFHSA